MTTSKRWVTTAEVKLHRDVKVTIDFEVIASITSIRQDMKQSLGFSPGLCFKLSFKGYGLNFN